MVTGDAYPFPTLHASGRFAFAVGTVAAVILLDRTLPTLVDDGSQFLLLGTAVVCSAWLGGLGPGLLAIVIGAVFGARDASGGAADMHLALFVAHGLLLTAIVAEMRHAHQAARRQARDAHEARLAGEAANRMKDEFLATISHELRTPMNAVLGWIHLLRVGQLDAATSRRGLDSIERNIRQQAQITADLLDVSRALTGQLRIESRLVSLSEAVREAVDTARTPAQAKHIEIVTAIGEPAVMVLGDASRLRQIVWHLLANAVKFTPSGGRVTLSLVRVGKRARLTVTDTGPGISADFLPRVFDRFAQEDASPTRMAAGLGVGLALVRDLVAMHGGEIAASNAVQGGAVFTMDLPAQPDGSTVHPTAAEPRAVTGPLLQGVRVLVFDRDLASGQVVQELLRQLGAAVRTAASAADALDSLEAWPPDVLIQEATSSETDRYSVVGREPGTGVSDDARIPPLALNSFTPDDASPIRLRQDTIQKSRKPLEPAVLTATVARLSGRERRRPTR